MASSAVPPTRFVVLCEAKKWELSIRPAEKEDFFGLLYNYKQHPNIKDSSTHLSAKQLLRAISIFKFIIQFSSLGNQFWLRKFSENIGGL